MKHHHQGIFESKGILVYNNEGSIVH